MKKSITAFIFIFFVLINVQTFAQKFGIQGGLNLSKILAKDNDKTYSNTLDYNLGYNAGFTLGLNLTNRIELEFGALIDLKGFREKEDDIVGKVNFVYADMPVLLKVALTQGPVKMFGAAGPYIGFGLTGKSITKYEGKKESNEVEWGNNEGEINRLDYGAKFGIGAETTKFSFGAYYSLGLANISNYTDNGQKALNRGFSLCIGYIF